MHFARIGVDNIKAAYSTKALSCGLVPSDSCPMWIDILCETPSVVSRPDERRHWKGLVLAPAYCRTFEV